MKKNAYVTFIALVMFIILITIVCLIGIQKTDENIQASSISKETTFEHTTLVDSVEHKVGFVITNQEREMLARLVYLESSICSAECQRAVVSVVFNRLESNRWKKDVNDDGVITLYDIIYYPNAFTPAYLIDSTTPNQEAYDAVDYVLEHGITVPTYVRYFRTKHDFSWEGYKNYTVIDNVYFGYFENWEAGAW